jgi:hypothetical protein
MSNPEQRGGPENEAQWDTIAIYEQILTANPDDADVLSELFRACLAVGETARALGYGERLGGLALDSAQDREAAAGMLAKLEAIRPFSPEAVQAAGRLEQFLNVAPAAPAPVARTAPPVASGPPSLTIDATRRRAVLADEMDMLWDLKQQGLVTEALYAGVVRDLTELTSSDSITTISALHGLSFRGFAGLDALLVQIGARASVPVITLSGFDLQPAVFGALPLDYLTFQGVIPFERLGGETLVAVLNPVSERLRNELPAALGCPCHYFLIPPADFDTAMEVVKNRYKAP